MQKDKQDGKQTIQRTGQVDRMICLLHFSYTVKNQTRRRLLGGVY